MKLRFRKNSLRLRLNRSEVNTLASGGELLESVSFPDESTFSYVLRADGQLPQVSFREGVISVSASAGEVKAWCGSEEVGIYFDLPTSGTRLEVAIEKDLECVDAPLEERDPDAYPRAGKGC